MSDINEIVDEIMEVEEPSAEQPALDADAIIDGITGEQDEKQEEPAAQEPEKKDNASTDEARKAELTAGLNEMIEDGYTVEEIQTICQDKQVVADIRAGKSLMRAVNAYERRQQTKTPAAKKGVPTVTTAAAAGVKDRSRIEEMSDKEFDEFSRRITEAAMSGKKVKIR